MNNLISKSFCKIYKLIYLVSILFLVGCSDSKILTEDTSLNDNNSKISITEIKDPFEDKKQIFTASYIEDGKVYGNLTTKKLGVVPNDEIDRPYMINENGEFIENKLEKEWLLEYYKLLNYNGLYTTGYDTTHEDLKKRSYYVDISQKMKYHLDKDIEYRNIIDSNLNNKYSEIYNFEKYYIEVYKNYMPSGQEKDFVEYKNRRNYLLIVDKENGKEYLSDLILDLPYIFYSNNEKSLMGINNYGEIYKVLIENEKIGIKKVDELPLEDYQVENLTGKLFTEFYSVDNIIFFNVRNGYNQETNKDDSKSLVIDLETKNWRLLEENSTLYFIKNTKYALKSKGNGDFELVELNNNLNFESLGTIKFSGEDVRINSVIGNKEGNKLFIALEQRRFNDQTTVLEKVNYYYINIER